LDDRSEIRNTGVVKTTGALPATVEVPSQGAGARAYAEEGGRADGAFGAGRAAAGDGGTRVAVARLLLERGPVTAVDVASELELSAAAVRRHLDALLADGEAVTREAPRRGRRGRGRPARLYLLTEAGRVRFGHGYDALAVAALRYLAETGGAHAVRAFADRRATELVERYRAGIVAADTVTDRVGALAAALSAQGYAAAARRAGSLEQLCQHHCPVAHVAAEFPQLCEAETHAFAELLGTHVQRLATIARGDAACTTHVPLGVPDGARTKDRAPLAERSTEPSPQARRSVDAPTTTSRKGGSAYDHRS
jgi:predicted ArsR family transcriptional regulator